MKNIHRVTVGATTVGSSPTKVGAMAIARIYSACCVPHTLHTPLTYWAGGYVAGPR